MLKESKMKSLARGYAISSKTSKDDALKELGEVDFYFVRRAKLEGFIYFGGRKIEMESCDFLLGFNSTKGVKFNQLPESVKAQFWEFVAAAQQDGEL